MHCINGTCVCLTGTFVLFVAERLDSFDGITIFIALTDSPILHFFQKVHSASFKIDHDFTFTLLNVGEETPDLFHYMVSFEDFVMPVSVFGIDTTEHCGPLSNIDLVHFVWDNFLRFSYKKYAMALSPLGPSKLPKLLYLKHYRVESDATKYRANCDDCVQRHREILSPFHSCDLSDKCTCKICTRQIAPDTYCSISLCI